MDPRHCFLPVMKWHEITQEPFALHRKHIFEAVRASTACVPADGMANIRRHHCVLVLVRQGWFWVLHAAAPNIGLSLKIGYVPLRYVGAATKH